MDIIKIKALKKELEEKIYGQLIDFQAQTGCNVDNISITKLSVCTIGSHSEQDTIFSVKIDSSL